MDVFDSTIFTPCFYDMEPFLRLLGGALPVAWSRAGAGKVRVLGAQRGPLPRVFGYRSGRYP